MYSSYSECELTHKHTKIELLMFQEQLKMQTMFQEQLKMFRFKTQIYKLLEVHLYSPEQCYGVHSFLRAECFARTQLYYLTWLLQCGWSYAKVKAVTVTVTVCSSAETYMPA